MEKNRIKKLLLSEYKDLSDIILIESPFAETTRNGRGVREVELGLTPSKLIIATDIFRNNNKFICPWDIDASIETLELVTIYPLQYITLSIFRTRQRKTLKARLIDGRANYFELGGINRSDKQWNLWCKYIKIHMSQKVNGSSLSETTAASSSSISTQYNLTSDVDEKFNNIGKYGNRCICRLWKYDADNKFSPSWTKKDIYLGPFHNDLGPNNYYPMTIDMSKVNIEYLRNELGVVINDNLSLYNGWWVDKFDKLHRKKYCNYKNDLSDILFTDESFVCGIDCISIPKLSRFGFGIDEKCVAGLYLPFNNNINRNNADNINGSVETFIDPYAIIESGVTIWERNKLKLNDYNNKNESRHLRRYGLAASPHFHYGLGPWCVNDGDKISIQSKRSLSCVNIRRQLTDIELKLPISKSQLTTSVSLQSLGSINTDNSCNSNRIILFWTPEYWYRPKNGIYYYHQLRKHLNCLHDYQQKNNEKLSMKFFRRNDINYYCNDDNNYVKMNTNSSCDRASCILNRIFLLNDNNKKKRKKINMKNYRSRSKDKLRNLLKMNLRINAWDLDSTTIAKQLTLIDRDLFLRISTVEIKILICEKSIKNTGNIGALIAFSHRISCLITSEILKINKLNMRARIVARFINAADKCFKMGNFQSCRSILAGLQSPAIYRLKLTWSHLKIYHSTNYELMRKLCRIFNNPRTKIYLNEWNNAEQFPPLIPYIGHILIRILALDDNSNSHYCQCRERLKIKKPISIEKFNDYGSTYLSQYNKSINNIVNNKININHSVNNVNLNNVNNIVCNCSDKKELIISLINRDKSIKNFILSALMRLRYWKYTRIISSRKSIFWAARQLILARKYFEHWQLFVMTARIIYEFEMQKKMCDIKMIHIKRVTSWLIMCQRYSQNYEFTGHEFAWEFLLKARYREERENFNISRKLEPLLN